MPTVSSKCEPVTITVEPDFTVVAEAVIDWPWAPVTACAAAGFMSKSAQVRVNANFLMR